MTIKGLQSRLETLERRNGQHPGPADHGAARLGWVYVTATTPEGPPWLFGGTVLLSEADVIRLQQQGARFIHAMLPGSPISGNEGQ